MARNSAKTADHDDTMNLDSMNLEQLREMRGQIDRAIAGFQDRKRDQARAAAEAAAREHGFALADLTGGRGGRGKRAAGGNPAQASAPKYAHPEDSAVTWTGRGRKPRWVNEHLEAGRNLDDLAI